MAPRGALQKICSTHLRVLHGVPSFVQGGFFKPHSVSNTVLGFRDKRAIYPLPYAFDILRFKVN